MEYLDYLVYGAAYPAVSMGAATATLAAACTEEAAVGRDQEPLRFRDGFRMAVFWPVVWVFALAVFLGDSFSTVSKWRL